VKSLLLLCLLNDVCLCSTFLVTVVAGGNKEVVLLYLECIVKSFVSKNNILGIVLFVWRGDYSATTRQNSWVFLAKCIWWQQVAQFWWADEISEKRLWGFAKSYLEWRLGTFTQNITIGMQIAV